MEARIIRAVILAAAVGSLGASSRTTNFVVTAPTAEMADEVAHSAEKYRRELAIDWLGKELPRWPQPCPITVQVGPQLGAGGATSFMFEHGEVFGWRMTIQGSRERILDSVLPHEVTHTIFATHFRQPLPRWADEGACTTVEHESERTKQQAMLISFLKSQPSRGIAFDRMFAMKEYPRDVLPLYAQGHSTARFLIAQGGRRKFVEFVGDGLNGSDWPAAVRKHYGYNDLGALQDAWLAWVRGGSPREIPTSIQGKTQVAAVSGADRADDDHRRGADERAASGTTAPHQALAADRTTVRPLKSNGQGVAARGASSAASRHDSSVAEWYARGRTPAKAQDDPPQARLLPRPTAKESVAASETSPDAAVRRQAVRPQPIEQPRQVILEWSRPRSEAPPGAVQDASLDRGRPTYR